jgi:transcriptional regulator with XRE-family HTH domain
MATKHLKEILEQRPIRGDARARVDTLKRLMELEVKLAELRESRGITQATIAEGLATSRPNISRIEHEDDLRVSTLTRYIDALGGQIEIRAVFPGDAITLIAAKVAPDLPSD